MPGSSLTYAGISNPVSPFYFRNIPLANISTTDDTINIGVTHNFVTGNPVWFEWWLFNSAAGTSGGITDNTKYFVIVVNSTTIKLASSLDNANSGIAIDITSFAINIQGIHISKFAQPYVHRVILPQNYPAYARSDIIFNSSVPVEINFTVPGYFTSMSTTMSSSAMLPVVVFFKQESASATWGLAAAYNSISNNTESIRIGNGLGTPIITGSNNVPSALTLGYNQKYVINTNRQIECWFAPIGSSLVLIYIIPALTANTLMRLEFGSSLSFCRMTDCNIKYL